MKKLCGALCFGLLMSAPVIATPDIYEQFDLDASEYALLKAKGSERDIRGNREHVGVTCSVPWIMSRRRDLNRMIDTGNTINAGATGLLFAEQAAACGLHYRKENAKNEIGDVGVWTGLTGEGLAVSILAGHSYVPKTLARAKVYLAFAAASGSMPQSQKRLEELERFEKTRK